MKTAAMIVLCAFSLLPLSASDLKIDISHSSVNFTVDHMQIAKSYGRFNAFDGKINFDGANPTASSFELTIDMNSVDTNNERRDKHLRGTDFFSVKQFPEATFKSTKVEQKGDKVLHVTGDFTMAGKTKSLTFEVTYTDQVDGRGGAKLRGFHITGNFNRSDFGVTYGIPNIGDEITVMVAIEASDS